MERKHHYIRFSGYFTNFLEQLFQNTLMKTSFTDFIKILGNGPWAAEDPILVVTYNISKNRLIYRRCLSGYC